MVDTNYEVHPEIAAAMPKGQVEEQQPEAQPEQPQEQVAAPQQETDSARNFRAIREAKERVERERDELYNRLKQIEARQAPTPEDDINLRPDDLVEWRVVQKKINQLEQKFSQAQQQTQEHTVEARLKAQYADFDQVVNKDTIETLRLTHPEIAQTINESTNLYSKAVSAYTMIKKLGIIPDADVKRDMQRAQANISKPKPLASINPQQADSPLSHANAFANGLTKELQEQLRKEMMQAMRER